MGRRDSGGTSDKQQDNENPCPDRTLMFSVSLCFKLREDLICYRLVTVYKWLMLRLSWHLICSCGLCSRCNNALKTFDFKHQASGKPYSVKTSHLWKCPCDKVQGESTQPRQLLTAYHYWQHFCKRFISIGTRQWQCGDRLCQIWHGYVMVQI